MKSLFMADAVLVLRHCTPEVRLETSRGFELTSYAMFAVILVGMSLPL